MDRIRAKRAKIAKQIARFNHEGEYYRRFIERTCGHITRPQMVHLRYMCRHRDGWKIKEKRVSYDLLRIYWGYLRRK